MDAVKPKGLSKVEQLALSLGEACDCMCSLDQNAGAQGAGKNTSTCGCFCAHNNDNANKSGANNKLSGLFEAIAALQ
jgi:hypothetical protein